MDLFVMVKLAIIITSVPLDCSVHMSVAKILVKGFAVMGFFIIIIIIII